MSPQKLRKLSDMMSKYLNFQAFVKSSSHHTIKSYANDLKQFLEPLGQY